MHVHDYVIIQAVTDLQDGTLKKGTGHQYKNFFFFHFTFTEFLHTEYSSSDIICDVLSKPWNDQLIFCY